MSSKLDDCFVTIYVVINYAMDFEEISVEIKSFSIFSNTEIEHLKKYDAMKISKRLEIYEFLYRSSLRKGDRNN